MLGCVSYGNLSNSTRLEPAQHSRSCAEIRGLPAAAGARLRVAPSGRGGGRPMTKQSFSQRRVSLSVLRIDRGAHLESAWRRQVCVLSQTSQQARPVQQPVSQLKSPTCTWCMTWEAHIMITEIVSLTIEKILHNVLSPIVVLNRSEG